MATPQGDQLRREMAAAIKRDYGGKVIVGFSGGKDSTAATIVCRRLGLEPVLVHLMPCPGVPLIERAIDDLERQLGQRVYRVLHPALLIMFRDCVFQRPERMDAIDEVDLPSHRYDMDGMNRHCARLLGMPNHWYVTGTRMADSALRRAALSATQGVSLGKRVWHIIADYTTEEVMRVVEEAGIKLPGYYRITGRSIDIPISPSLVHLALAGEREDWRALTAVFPLARLAVYRYLVYFRAHPEADRDGSTRRMVERALARIKEWEDDHGKNTEVEAKRA